MRVVKAYPPNYGDIKRAFNLDGTVGVIFSWGDRIFAPNLRAPLSPALQAHEAVHGERQLAFPGQMTAWWEQYIADPQFRLDEEVPAHRAEFAWHVKNEGRGGRERALNKIALRLSSRLYGSVCTYAEAERLITA